ncbi:MAG: hypothetical protein ACUVX9_11440 [Anaerolineae bacterium]
MSPYGDGHFGHWITDEAGLPAYEYTCDHARDPAAEYRTHAGPSRDHYHLLGNLRAKALAHNEGYIEVFSPDTLGCWLNRYAPQRRAYAGGFGYIRLDGQVRSTLYQHLGSPLYRRVFGAGYFRKVAVWGDLAIDQVAFVPFGADPVLLHITTLTNRGGRALRLSYVEYWDVLVEPVLRGHGEAWRLLQALRPKRVTVYDEARRLLLCSPLGGFAGLHTLARGRDPDPPVVFLAAIDDLPVTSYETDRDAFFGQGGVASPSALEQPFLCRGLAPAGARGGRLILTLQREVAVPPRGLQVLAHLYGYARADDCRCGGAGSASPEGLVERYAARPALYWWQQSLEQWAERMPRWQSPGDGWVAREAAWSAYHVQALARLHAYTGEITCDPGGAATFAWGLQPTPRGCCRAALALLPNNPAEIRGTIRHLARLSRPDGAISHPVAPAGLAGVDGEAGDLGLWLLWLIADYCLLYRDRAFLDQAVSFYPQSTGHSATIAQVVRRLFERLPVRPGFGPRRMLRLDGGDGNPLLGTESGLTARLPGRAIESTQSTALAILVMGQVAELWRWSGESAWAAEAEQLAARLRLALEEAWNGRWFERLLPRSKDGVPGPLHLDCQPWAALASSPARRFLTLHAIRERLMAGSPLGPTCLEPPEPLVRWERGAGPNGGWWAGATGALVWAWALEDGAAAWEVLKVCTLAAHAESYPEQWSGIWSRPEYMNSHQSGLPGAPSAMRPPFWANGHATSEREFPIASAEAHAPLLFALWRLSGLQADSRGLRFTPLLPWDTLALEAARFGLRVEPGRISGYLVPQGNERMLLRVRPFHPPASPPRAMVDGKPAPAEVQPGGEVAFPAFVRCGTRTEWEVRWSEGDA